MSIYDKARLIQTPSGYKASKLYSAIPQSGVGDFDLIRSGLATQTNKQGFIETVNANVPRLNYPFIDGVLQECPQLLLEGKRTNEITYSEELEGVGWSRSNMLVTNASEILDPANGSETRKLKRISTGASYAYNVFNKQTSRYDYTSSFYIKKGVGDYVSFKSQGLPVSNKVDVRFQFSTKSIYYTNETFPDFKIVSTKVEELKNGWFRVSWRIRSDVSNQLVTFISPRSSDGNIDDSDSNSDAFVYVFGAMVEKGVYPTSYIRTTGSSVTRNLDKLGNAGNSTLFDFTEGVLFLDSFTNDFGNSVYWWRISLSDATNFNNIELVFNSSGSSISFIMSSGGTTYVNETIPFTFDQVNKIAFSFKAGEYKGYINGVLVFSTNQPQFPLSLSTLNFSNPLREFGTFYKGRINQLVLFDELTHSELQTLTTL